MKLPPYVLGAALAGWGLHTDLAWLGVPLALLAELPRFLDWRWELQPRERQRIADFCSLLILVTSVVLYLNSSRLGSAVILLIQWLPALLFPLLTTQLYEGRQGVEMSVLFLSLRGRAAGEEQLDLTPPYLLVCVIAAAMVPMPSPWYLPGLGLLVAGTLWGLRPSCWPRGPWVWGALLAVAIGLGQLIGEGLRQAHEQVGDWVVAWLADWISEDWDPYRADTAIGDVGRLKSAERVLLRVWPDAPPKSPLLLRTGSYNRYVDGTWLADSGGFDPLVGDQRDWRLPGEGDGVRRVRVTAPLPQGRGPLPLPDGTRLIGGLAAAALSRNAAGVVRIADGPPLARYQVQYGAVSADAPPNEVDLRVPAKERAGLDRLVGEWGLDQAPPPQAVDLLRRRFVQEFTYSLDLTAPKDQRSPLDYFLFEGHRGHCEYFATSAVLLLRRAGIPSRYLRGWSIQEYSDMEQAYVARGRHAHAWVQVWLEGTWREFDPTPTSWGDQEADARPWWGYALDGWDRVWFGFQLWQETGTFERTWLAIGLPPLVAWFAWRIIRRGQRRRGSVPAADLPALARGPFTQVEAVLAGQGWPRRPGETLAHWVARLEREGASPAADLQPALRLWYRLRFDPACRDQDGDRRMRRSINRWLRRHGRSSADGR